VFQEPDHLLGPSWVEHIPFAFWIVDALRPETLVEVGTESGNSYAAFAQTVEALGLPTACYGIETWQGDRQIREENVLNGWRDYHRRRFSTFSRLTRASAADAVRQFADDSIDLLHLDGYHARGAQRHDLAMWLPKMSHRGVVLLHDVNAIEKDQGAWHEWREIEQAYPSFTFLHESGLGVLGVGRDLPEPVAWLLRRPSEGPEQVSEIRLFFSQMGRRLSLQHENTEAARTIGELRARLAGGESNDRRSVEPRAGDEIPSLVQRLQEECDRRDRTIRELDADVRALASRVETLPPGTSPRQGGVRAAQALRRSPLWRVGIVLRTAPSLLAMASRSDSVRRTVRNVSRLLSPRRLTSACIVARSTLFHEAYYAARNPDVGLSGVHPLIHYVLWGAFEGRRPNVVFDPAYYLEQYPDVARAGLEPLSHFVVHGTREQRNPGPDFDTKFYLETNADVRESGVNPLVHFFNGGWREGRNPLPSFDCGAYVAKYEDVRTSGVNPLAHYIEIGRLEGRRAAPISTAPLPAPPRVQLTAQALRPRDPDRPIIVCLTHVCPFPPFAGNAYRIDRMLTYLQSAGFGIVPVIVPLGGEMPDGEAIRRVEKQYGNVVVVDRSGAIQYSLTDIPDVLASLDREHTPRYAAVLGEDTATDGRGRELLIIDRTYCPDAAIAVLLRLQSALGRYVLFAEYVWMTRVLPLVDNRAIKVLDTIDVFSSKKDKVIRHGIRDFWLERDEEARRLGLADVIVAIQAEEHDVLQTLAPGQRVVTAGIDFDMGGDPRLPDCHRVLYVGSANPMNVRGLRDFLKFAWPGIQEQVPDAELSIVGAVGDTLLEVPPGVAVLGRVADLVELYRNTRVVINPAIAGTGVKIKTVEALCHLRPIVTWPTGVDGLPREVADLCDTVHDWFEFSGRVAARLLTDRESAFSEADRHVIEHATSPKTVYADLLENLRTLWQQRIAR
jgi:hypothetical protein